MPARDWSENWKGGDQFEDLNVDGSIILKQKVGF
jgi:hypothetical protein